MENINELTPIELQKLGNDIKLKHDMLKQDIITLTHQMEELENILKEKAETLQDYERQYVEIVEKLIN